MWPRPNGQYFNIDKKTDVYIGFEEVEEECIPNERVTINAIHSRW